MGARLVQLSRRSRRLLGVGLLVALGIAAGLIVTNRASTSQGPPPAGTPPDWRPAPNARVVLHHPTHAPPGGWVFKTFLNREGWTCYAEVVPGEGEGGSCSAPGTMFRKTPLVTFLGSRQAEGDFDRWENAWVWGFAEKPIAHVQLVLTDCTVRDLAVDADGVYADVEGPETLHAGAWPYKVVGLTGGGRMVATREVRLGPPHGGPSPAVPASCA
jgi:hypothetical protein